MYRTIMVPLDGSRLAETALPVAVSLARATGAELRLVTVQEPMPSYALEGWEYAIREQRRGYLAQVESRLDNEMTSGVATALVDGLTPDAIETVADRGNVDLIVMASHGRGATSRLWLGSVADALIRRADRPVLVIRPAAGEEGDAESAVAFRKILIPLDGSEGSEAALADAVELGVLYGASYTLLRVVPYPMGLGSPYLPDTIEVNRSLLDDATTAANGYLQAQADLLAKRGYEVRTEVKVAPQPARAILEACEAGGYDLIAMSTQGRGQVGRLVLGSTADKVLTGAAVPVLLHRQRA